LQHPLVERRPPAPLYQEVKMQILTVGDVRRELEKYRDDQPIRLLKRPGNLHGITEVRTIADRVVIIGGGEA
jgi:hypothetical protein